MNPVFQRALFLTAVLLGALALEACTAASDNSGPAATEPIAARPNLRIVEDLPPPDNTNHGSDEPVAENDLLVVEFFQISELNREVRVDASGSISLALIGRIAVAGMTIPEIEDDIEKRYSTRYLQNPEVTVSLKESAGNRVTVDGEVRKPGVYPVSGRSTLIEVIALAGGFSEIADDRKLYVFRKFGADRVVANYDVRRIREGRSRDPRIFGGDVIVSFSSTSKVAARDLREALGIASRAASIAAPF